MMTFWMGAKGGFERELPKLYAAARSGSPRPP